jgi:hypothetical protein
MTVINGTGIPNSSAQTINIGQVGQFQLVNTCGLVIPAGTYVSGTIQVSYNTAASLIVNPGAVSVSPSVQVGTGPNDVLATAQALGSYNMMYTLQAADIAAVNASAGGTATGTLTTNYDVNTTAWAGSS